MPKKQASDLLLDSAPARTYGCVSLGDPGLAKSGEREAGTQLCKSGAAPATVIE
jgi:hypothetical protein